MFYNENTILESGGLYGESSIHLLDLDTFSVYNKHNNRDDVFAEGCTFIETK